MIRLTEGNYNTTLRSDQDLMIFVMDPSDPHSEILSGNAERIDRLLGKDFIVCTVDASSESEILHVLSVKNAPEAVSIRNRKIYKRLRREDLSGNRLEQQLLGLMK